MKLLLAFIGTFLGVMVILYLIGMWSTRKRLARAKARYGNLMPVIAAMADRTKVVRRLPGYQKWDTQISKDQVQEVFNTNLTIQAVELPDGQIWTRDDMR